MKLELNEAEREALVEILDRTIADLRVEVRRTRTPDFHDDLVKHEVLLKGLASRLGGD